MKISQSPQLKRVLQVLLAVLFGRGIMAVRQVVLVPILLRCWGAEYYGGWLILSAVPSFLAMSNLGLGTSAATRIATVTGVSDVDAGRKTLYSAWWTIFGIMMLTVLSLQVWHIFDSSGSGSLPDGFQVLNFLVIGLFIRMLGQPVHGWWVTIGKAQKSMQFGNIYSLVELAIYMLIPFLHGKAVVLSMSLAIWACVWFVLYVIMSAQKGCKLLRATSPSLEEIKVLLGSGIGHQLSPLWQGFLFQGSIMMAGKLLGSEGAALWGGLRVVNRTGNQMQELVSQTVGPEFQLNHANKKLEENRDLHARSILLSLAMGTTMALGLMLCGSTMFKIWTHGAFHEPKSIWYILPLSLIPFSCWWVSGEYQRSLNKPWTINIAGTISSLICLLVIYLLKNMGIVAFAIGGIVFELLMTFFVVKKSLDLLDESLRTYIKRILTIIKKSSSLQFKSNFPT